MSYTSDLTNNSRYNLLGVIKQILKDKNIDIAAAAQVSNIPEDEFQRVIDGKARFTEDGIAAFAHGMSLSPIKITEYKRYGSRVATL